MAKKGECIQVKSCFPPIVVLNYLSVAHNCPRRAENIWNCV